MGTTRADSVRDRTVSAVTVEFSLRGIAGQRMDRVTRAAGTSTERVYAYFSGKAAPAPYSPSVAAPGSRVCWSGAEA